MTDFKDLQDFVEQIISIQAPNMNAFGTGVPGNAGIAASPTNSSMEITILLKKKTTDFADACKNSSPKKDILKLSKDIEGLLLNEQLMNVLSEKQVNHLIDALHAIVSERSK